MARTSAARFWGTIQAYCHASPSRNPRSLSGTKCAPNDPSAIRGCTNPVAGLNRRCQFCARRMNVDQTDHRSSAAASRAMAKSSVAYSSVVAAELSRSRGPNEYAT